MTAEQHDIGYCAWCFRPVKKDSGSGGYFCNTCDHAFGSAPLDHDEVPFEHEHMMSQPNEKPTWA